MTQSCSTSNLSKLKLSSHLISTVKFLISEEILSIMATPVWYFWDMSRRSVIFRLTGGTVKLSEEVPD